MTQENSQSVANVYLQQERDDSAVRVTESEIAALDSERVKQIVEFSDDEIRMLKMKDLSTSVISSRDTGTLMVDLSKLRIYPGLNPRLPSEEWEAHIEYLASVMLEQGFWVHKPIYGFVSKMGKNNVIYIADGESRFRAAMLAKERGADIDEIPVRLAPEGTSIEQIMLQLAPSNKGREFTPLEKALLAQRQMTAGRSVGQVAENLSCSPEYVHQLLALASAPSKVREMVRLGTVPAAMAIEVVRSPTVTNPVTTLETAVENAKKQGKNKATAKHLPQNLIEKSVKKHATSMHSVLVSLRESEAYVLLNDEIKDQIESLIANITKDSAPKAEKEPKPAKQGGGKRGGKKTNDVENAADGEEPADTMTMPLDLSSDSKAANDQDLNEESQYS
jgi:ParB-like chromosome segregation protein Spo0J